MSSSATMPSSELERLELKLFVTAIASCCNVDFSDYAQSSFRRRVLHCMAKEGVATISALQDRVLHDRAALDRLLAELCVRVTAMFRNPEFFAALREVAVPRLKTYPFVRIWVAGCSTGEEVYSLCVLLKEEGIYDKCRIYATDMNRVVLDRAEKGIFEVSAMQGYTRNYQLAGGKQDFSNYYTARYGSAIFRPELRQNIVFSQHNLATDSDFNEFHLILCRNVMIYFNNELQARVYRLLDASLCPLGMLGLGRRESMTFSPHSAHYKQLLGDIQLYRKTR